MSETTLPQTLTHKPEGIVSVLTSYLNNLEAQFHRFVDAGSGD